MRSFFKQAATVSIFLLICAIVIGSFVFFFTARKNTSGMITNAVEIVDINDTRYMESLKSIGQNYAVIAREGSKYFLVLHGNFDGHGFDAQGRFALSKEQYNSLKIAKQYWFDIKFSKLNDWKTGVVKNIYTYKPF